MARPLHAADPAELAAQGDDDGGDHALRIGLLAHDRGDVALDLEQHALLLLEGDVAAGAAVAGEASAVVEHRATAQRQVVHLALRIDLRELEILERPVCLAGRPMRVPVGMQEVGLGMVPAAPPDQGAPPRPDHRVDRIRQERDAVLRIGLPDPVGAQVGEVAELGFARGQLLLHRAHAGDVLHHAGDAHRFAAGVALGTRHAAYPDHFAVGPDPAEFHPCLAPVAHARAVGLLPARLIVGMDVGEELGRRRHAGGRVDAEQPQRAGAQLQRVVPQVVHPRTERGQVLGRIVALLELVQRLERAAPLGQRAAQRRAEQRDAGQRQQRRDHRRPVGRCGLGMGRAGDEHQGGERGTGQCAPAARGERGYSSGGRFYRGSPGVAGSVSQRRPEAGAAKGGASAVM